MGRITAYLLQDAARREALGAGATSAAARGCVRLAGMDTRGPLPAILSPPWLAWAALRLVAGAASGRLGLLHVNVAERGSVLRKGVLVALARLLGIPVLLHLHAAQITAFHDGLPAPGRALLRRMFRAASLCVVLGEPWRRWVAGLGVPSSRIRVLRNGVPLPGSRRLHRVPGAAFRVVFLGNLLERKGVADLLEALSLLDDPLGPAWTACFAGGGDVAGFRARADALSLGWRVRFTGWLDQAEAASCLADADVLVLPSFDEGLPLVILEALGLGVPVIATPVGAIPEVLEDGRHALLVPPGNPMALAAALVRLMRDPSLQERLSREGRTLYEREFTMERYVQRLTALHDEVAL